MKNIIVLCLAVVLLAACRQPQTYEAFMENPKLIKPALKECAQHGKATPSCAAAKRAYRDFEKLLRQHQYSPFEFGKSIIEVQTQISGLTEKLHQTAGLTDIEREKTEMKISFLQMKLNRFYAIVRMSGPGQ